MDESWLHKGATHIEDRRKGNSTDKQHHERHAQMRMCLDGPTKPDRGGDTSDDEEPEASDPGTLDRETGDVVSGHHVDGDAGAPRSGPVVKVQDLT